MDKKYQESVKWVKADYSRIPSNIHHMIAKEHLDNLQELIDKYAELEKALEEKDKMFSSRYEQRIDELEQALDKACELLSRRNHFLNETGIVCSTGGHSKTKEEWKEYLLKEKDNETSNT